MSDDRGSKNLVAINNTMGPKLIGSFNIVNVGKHMDGRKKRGQKAFIRTLAATIHANNTQENPTDC